MSLIASGGTTEKRITYLVAAIERQHQDLRFHASFMSLNYALPDKEPASRAHSQKNCSSSSSSSSVGRYNSSYERF